MAGLGIPQTDYGFQPPCGYAGMRYRAGSFNDEVVHYPASAAIKPGRLVEVVSGAVREAQSANGALSPLAGVALYKDYAAPVPNTAPSGYAAGDMVPVLRKGRVFAAWAGTTQGELVTANYKHSTTTEANQGVITDAATASTTGAEIDAMPQGMRIVRAVTGAAALGIVLIELNLPAD